jgi:hypothetical protein
MFVVASTRLTLLDILQSNIESVKQPIANHKDIKEVKEKLAVQLKDVQKTTLI